MKRSPLNRSKVFLRRTPLRRRSWRMEKLYRQLRVPLVERFLREHPLCQRCLMARSTDPHELTPRGRGGSIIDEDEPGGRLPGMSLAWIHGHPLEATERRLAEKETDHCRRQPQSRKVQRKRRRFARTAHVNKTPQAIDQEQDQMESRESRFFIPESRGCDCCRFMVQSMKR